MRDGDVILHRQIRQEEHVISRFKSVLRGKIAIEGWCGTEQVMALEKQFLWATGNVHAVKAQHGE